MPGEPTRGSIRSRPSPPSRRASLRPLPSPLPPACGLAPPAARPHRLPRTLGPPRPPRAPRPPESPQHSGSPPPTLGPPARAAVTLAPGSRRRPGRGAGAARRCRPRPSLLAARPRLHGSAAGVCSRALRTRRPARRAGAIDRPEGRGRSATPWAGPAAGGGGWERGAGGRALPPCGGSECLPQEASVPPLLSFRCCRCRCCSHSYSQRPMQ